MSSSRPPYAWFPRQFSVAAPLAIVGFIALAAAAHAQTYTFTTFAGQPGGIGVDDGTGAAARFNQPTGIAVDGAGNMYVADMDNHTIRKMTPAGVVTTLAGRAGQPGSNDGSGGLARFKQPMATAADAFGNIYVADFGNNTIRKIDSGGVVTTFAGIAGTTGSADGTGSAAQFKTVRSVAVDTGNNVFVSDQGNHTIRKISPAGVVTTFAGLAGSPGSTDGTGSAARFNLLAGITIDASNTVYVADQRNYAVRKVTAAGVVTTIAGNPGLAGDSDGTGSAARFRDPVGISTDASGNIFVADQTSNTIRKVTAGGVVTTFAGQAGITGATDGAGAAALFGTPTGLTSDASSNIYIADQRNHTIRKMTPLGDVTTFAGSPGGLGAADGNVNVARFWNPESIGIDPANGDMYVGETFTIRKISNGVVTTLAGTPGVFGSVDGTGSAAQFRYPGGIVVDGQDLYVCDRANQTIRKVTTAGVVTTFAGVVGVRGSTDGIGTVALFSSLSGMVMDVFKNLYVTEYFNQTVRMITPGAVVSTIAGFAGSGGTADGTGSAARFYSPYAMAMNGAGVLYVADNFGQKIRSVTTPGGVVTTIAGAAFQTGSADGNGSAARFNSPIGGAIDNAGNVFVADRGNGTIRMINPGGDVTTVAGTPGVFGDTDGTGAEAKFTAISGMAIDASGNLYVADTNANKIRVGRPGLPDTATIDSPTGAVSQPRTLSVVPATGATWLWTVIRQPGNSMATIFDDRAPLASFIPDVPGVYTFRLTATAGPSSSITSVTLTVGPLPTLTKLTATPNPSAYGQSVVLTASVLSEGTPGQSVTFYDAGIAIGSLALDRTGKAQLTLSTLAAGVHVLTASYSGDGQFDPSNSDALAYTVNRATISVGCVPSLNPSTDGNSVTFTSSLSRNAATGTITFRDGTTILATVALPASGSKFAQFTTSTLSPGLHSITATYDGDGNFMTAVSGVTQSVHALFGPPPNLVATATSVNSVTVNWTFVTGADHYEIVQTSGPNVILTTAPTNTATVTGLTPGTTYIYRVRSISPTGTASGYSYNEPATTIMFIDDPIVAGVTVIRAVHMDQLREGVNAMRASVNLLPAVFQGAGALTGSPVKAVHMNELRSALLDATGAMGLMIRISDFPIVGSSTIVKATHFTEIRDGMR